MKKALWGLLLSTALVGAANAADMPTKAMKYRALAPIIPCTVMSCVSKFYVGAGLAGNGTNANIIGNGLTGSVFAGGGIPFVDAGWMSWNGTVLVGFEAGAGYQINTGATTINASGSVNPQGYMAYQEVQVGGALSQIFGGASPVVPPTGLTADLMTLYVAGGAEEHSYATGWRTGAGAKFILPNSNMIIDIGYRYTNFGAAQVGSMPTGIAQFNAINLVYAKFDIPLN